VRVAFAFGFEPTWQLDDGKYAWRAEAPLTPLDTSRLRA
jgi:hypothetical protein